MNISRKEKKIKFEAIEILYFDFNLKQYEIAEVMKLHRNTIANYLKFFYKD